MDLSLNIICEKRCDVEQQQMKKPKKAKYNKYDKRRERGRLVREKVAAVEAATSNSTASSVDFLTVNTLAEAHVKDKIRPQFNKATSSIKSSEVSAEVLRTTPTNADIQPALDEKEVASTTSSVELIISNESSSSIFVNTETHPIQEKDKHVYHTEKDDRDHVHKNDIKVSRRNQHSVTIQRMEQKEKRAEYMINYHATPYEMDRKRGAVSRFKESKESSHIFDTESRDIHNVDKSSINHGHCEDEPLCPFEGCGLHPKIINAITRSKGCGYFLDRPTLIQRNTWNQMLRQQETQVKTPNFLIQSETGSGKTLAYFLPVLQVRFPNVIPKSIVIISIANHFSTHLHHSP